MALALAVQRGHAMWELTPNKMPSMPTGWCTWSSPASLRSWTCAGSWAYHRSYEVNSVHMVALRGNMRRGDAASIRCYVHVLSDALRRQGRIKPSPKCGADDFATVMQDPLPRSPSR